MVQGSLDDVAITINGCSINGTMENTKVSQSGYMS